MHDILGEHTCMVGLFGSIFSYIHYTVVCIIMHVRVVWLACILFTYTHIQSTHMTSFAKRYHFCTNVFMSEIIS